MWLDRALVLRDCEIAAYTDPCSANPTGVSKADNGGMNLRAPLLLTALAIAALALLVSGCARDEAGSVIHTPPVASKPAPTTPSNSTGTR